jgi:hypothetical protein
MALPGEGMPACSHGLEPLETEERRWLGARFAPLRQALAWLLQLERDPEAIPPGIGPPDSPQTDALTVLAAEVGAGLVRHGLALRRLDL